MRQAIGGAWLYGIVIVFMMFMIAYVSATLNYSRAYKTKTQVVNIIEEYQGVVSGEKPMHVCITRTAYKASKALYTDYFYDVTMFFKFNIPIFGDIFTFSVKGETNSIYYPTDNSNWS